jgi:hypothetical protein
MARWYPWGKAAASVPPGAGEVTGGAVRPPLQAKAAIRKRGPARKCRRGAVRSIQVLRLSRISVIADQVG